MILPEQIILNFEKSRVKMAHILGLLTIAWIANYGEVKAQEPVTDLSKSSMEWIMNDRPGIHDLSSDGVGSSEKEMSLIGDSLNLGSNNFESGNRDPEDDGTEFVKRAIKTILTLILCGIASLGLPTLTYINAIRKDKDRSEKDEALFNSRSKARPTTRRDRKFNKAILEILSGKKRENISNALTQFSTINEVSSGADEVITIMQNKFVRRPLSGERIGDRQAQVTMKGKSMVGVFNDGEQIPLNRREYIIAPTGEFGQVGDMVAIEYRPRNICNVENTATAIGIFAGIFKGYPLLLSTHNTKGEEGGHGLITSVPVEPGNDVRTYVLWSISKSQNNAEELVKQAVEIIIARGDYYQNESRQA